MFWFLLVFGIGVFVALVLWVYACLTAKKNFYRWARNGLPRWATYEIYCARYQFGPPYEWGINLVSVKSITINRQKDGQLKDLHVEFIPA